MSIDLNTLTQNELKALQSAIPSLLTARRETMKDELATMQKTIVDFIEKTGFSISDLIPKMKLAPKYRNPANPDQSWSGRGKKPLWVSESLANGGKLEDFEIQA